MFVFWGTDDDLLHSFNVMPDFGAAFRERGIVTATLDGCDHAGAIFGFGDVAESVVTWLDTR